MSSVTASGAASLAAGSVHWPALRELSLSAELSPTFFHALAAGSWPSLETLDLNHSAFVDLTTGATSEIGEAMAGLLAGLPALRAINLGYLQPFDPDALNVLLGESARRVALPALEGIMLSRCYPDAALAALIADAAEAGRWPRLRYVTALFNSTVVGSEGDRAASELARIGSLKKLALPDFGIGDGYQADDVRCRFEAMPPGLKALVLVQNKINDVAMLRVLGGDWRFNSLEVLALDGNEIGEAGAALLAKATAEGRLPALKEMWIGMLGPAGLVALFSAPWKRLKRFWLSEDAHHQNPVGVAGAAALGRAAAQGYLPALQALLMPRCRLNAHKLELIFGQAAWPSLLEINVGKNAFGDRGCRVLASYAHNMPALRILRVKNCYMGNKGLAALLGGRTTRKWALDFVEIEAEKKMAPEPDLSRRAYRLWHYDLTFSVFYPNIYRRVRGREVPRDSNGERLPTMEQDILSPYYSFVSGL